MPYIPPQNRPSIDAAVDAVAAEIAAQLTRERKTAEISELYRDAFARVAEAVATLEREYPVASPATVPGAAERLARAIVDAAKGYNTKGGWLGELNYALTMLIQQVPRKMKASGAWDEALRYWIYAETVGALVRTSYELHTKHGNTWIGNGLAGVFEDVKDEYKRRVNTAYEAAQILKSGDCYDATPFRTRLVPFEHGGVRGFIEIMLPKMEP